MTSRWNLILAYRKGSQDPEDFRKIANSIIEIEPTIDVFVVDSQIPSLKLAVRAANRPTLVVSPRRLSGFVPARGRIFCGYPMAKETQLNLMRAADIPVPDWEILRPETSVDTSRFGAFAVVKPAGISSYGRGVMLRRTRSIRCLPQGDYPLGHPGRLGPLLVQRFIDTGPRPSKIRVLTLFGEPLYAEKIMTEDEYPFDEQMSDQELEKHSIIVIDKPRDRTFVYDKDVLNLARSIFRAAPMIPLQGCDIIREHSTGKLYALEFNPGGNTWHFSSRAGAPQRVEGRRRETQFGAFEVAARVLVEWVRKSAL